MDQKLTNEELIYWGFNKEQSIKSCKVCRNEIQKQIDNEKNEEIMIAGCQNLSIADADIQSTQQPVISDNDSDANTSTAAV
jgi:hypothetical protein